MIWYYAEGSVRHGPVEEAVLKELVRTNVIRDTTLVWHDGMANWEPFSRFRAQFPPPPPPPPPVQPAAAPAARTFCTNCGRASAPHEITLVGGRQICDNCKAAALREVRAGVPSPASHNYAGFWIRFVAVLIDALLLGAVNFAISMVFSLGTMALFGLMGGGRINTFLPFLTVLLYPILVALWMGYDVWFVANKGATPGKLAMGLRIVRAQGGEIGYGLATGRFFAKMLSGMILYLGFIIAAFDPQKLALHDRLCGTYVVKK